MELARVCEFFYKTVKIYDGVLLRLGLTFEKINLGPHAADSVGWHSGGQSFDASIFPCVDVVVQVQCQFQFFLLIEFQVFDKILLK